MNRKSIKEFLPILAAYAEGKIIQYRHSEDDDWEDPINNSTYPGPDLRYPPDRYRVKPQSMPEGPPFIDLPTVRILKISEDISNECYRIKPIHDFIISQNFIDMADIYKELYYSQIQELADDITSLGEILKFSVKSFITLNKHTTPDRKTP